MIDVYYLINKILDNAAIVVIPGFPLSAQIRHDFPQQFPGKVSGMVPGFFRKTPASKLPLSPSQLALRPSRLPLSPSPLPLRPSDDAVLGIGIEKVEDAIGAMQGNEDRYK